MSRVGGVLVLAAALAGGIVGYVVGRETGARAPLPAAPLPRSEAARSPAPPSPEKPGGLSSLEAVLDALPTPRVEPGEGRISGHVRLEDGTPVPGVLVRAEQVPAYTPPVTMGTPPPEQSLAESVRALVRRRRLALATRTETRTGPDGAFVLQGLAHARYALRAFRHGYRIYSRRTSYAWPGGKVDFSARRIAGVRVRVLRPDGSEAKEVRVEYRRPGSGRARSGVTGTVGYLELEPGSWLLAAVAEGGAWKSPEVRVEVTAGEVAGPVELRLEARPGIEGRVVPPEGETLRFVEVLLLPIAPGTVPDPDRLRRDGKRASLWTRSSNHFLFPDLPPGTYFLAAMVSGGVLVSEEVTVENGLAARDLVIPPADPENSVIVHVYGPDGKPVTDADVSTGYRSRTSRSSATGTISRLTDGSYRVPHHPVDEDMLGPDGTWYVRVASPAYGTLEREYEKGKDREITIRFEEPARLAVRLVGYPGSELQGHLGFFLDPRKKKGSFRAAIPGRPGRGISPEGTLDLGPVPPGAYELVVSILLDSFRSIPAARIPVTLRAGDNDLAVPLPAVYTLTVRTGEEVSRLTLRATSPEEPHNLWLTKKPANGRIVFPRLPAGEYALSDERGRQMSIRIPDQVDVVYTPREMNAMRVIVTDPAGFLARAGFRNGDVIVGVDGKRFANRREMQMRLQLAMTQEKARFLVVRGGRETEITTSLKALFDRPRPDLGGRFRETSR